MSNRKAAVSGLLVTAVAFAGACSDISPPTEPLAFDQEVSLFGAATQRAGSGEAFGLDAAFVRIAQQHPGFGGFFYGEDGALNIVSAGAQTMSLRALGGSLGGLGVDMRAQPVRVIAGEYDFIQLHAMHRSVSAVMGLQGVVFSDADEGRNRVVVGVEDAAAAAAVERAVEMLGLPDGAVIVEITEPIEPLQTLQSMVRPVAGGLQINFTRGDPPAGFVCTLGFNVRSPQYPNVHGFVTNSHCSDTRGVVVPTPYWQHSRFVEGTFIGWEEHDLPFFTDGVCPAGRRCRYSDALGARYVDGVNNLFGAIYKTTTPGQHSPAPLTIDPANPLFTIVSETPYPTLGQTVHKVGRTTGWLIGPVIATCILTNTAPDVSILCQDRVEATPAGGDSGSPVFIRIGETLNVSLTGILWGGSANTYVFSSMQNVRCENQGPAPWITYPGQTPPAPTGCPGR